MVLSCVSDIRTCDTKTHKMKLTHYIILLAYDATVMMYLCHTNFRILDVVQFHRPYLYQTIGEKNREEHGHYTKNTVFVRSNFSSIGTWSCTFVEFF